MAGFLLPGGWECPPHHTHSGNAGSSPMEVLIRCTIAFCFPVPLLRVLSPASLTHLLPGSPWLQGSFTTDPTFGILQRDRGSQTPMMNGSWLSHPLRPSQRHGVNRGPDPVISSPGVGLAPTQGPQDPHRGLPEQHSLQNCDHRLYPIHSVLLEQRLFEQSQNKNQ